MPYKRTYRAAARTAAAIYAGARSVMKGRKAAPTKKRVTTRRRKATRGSTRRLRNTTETQVSAYTRQSYVKGRKPRQNLRSAWKLLNQNIANTVYRMGQYSAFAGTSGLLQLKNISPTATTGPFETPMHLWEVTACPNIVNGVVTTPQIGWFPTLSTPLDSATLSWQQAFGFTVENSDNATNIIDNYPNANDTLEWVQAKMIFYAPTTRPSRFQVDLVQFKDTRLVPDANTGVTQFATAFYQAMSKRFAFSPLETGDTKYQKYLKVLDSKTFIIEPKETTDTVNTNMKEVNLFYRLNRRCTYDWADQDRMDMLVNAGQINTGQTISTQVHPRARIFLIVRGQAANGPTFSTTTMPSYDILLRSKHSHLSQ